MSIPKWVINCGQVLIDQEAQSLVQQYYQDDKTRNQAYKMRTSVAYGLERFWGEQFRLTGTQSQYWRDTWNTLVNIMSRAGIEIPNQSIEIPDNDPSKVNPDAIQKMAEQLWEFPLQQRKVALAVLTQLCDCLVWWTQRYKKLAGGNDND